MKPLYSTIEHVGNKIISTYHTHWGPLIDLRNSTRQLESILDGIWHEFYFE